MESGIIYGTFIDPILSPMRKRVANEIYPGEKVLEIACGTGDQIFEMAPLADKLVGIDHSPSMLRFAEKRKTKLRFNNVTFLLGDAITLVDLESKSFDVALLSLALHQFHPDFYAPVLNEMKRVAKRLILVDYAVPLPKNYTGIGIKAAEFLAGKEHNKNFRSYYKIGGLSPILGKHSITIEKSVIFGNGGFKLVVCSIPE